MKYLFKIILTFITICNAQQLKKDINRDSNFLDVTVKNSELQIQIDNLKNNYEIELNKLKTKFKSEKKSLRKNYKEKYKMMKKEFKKNNN